MDWKHDCGYEEPKECGFCKYFEEFCRRKQASLKEFTGACWRNAPITASEANPVQAAEWCAEHTCHTQGTCRHFMRRK